jgi:hypothetical protein
MTSEVSTFEDLEVFQRAYRVSLDVHKTSLQFPKVEQFGGLADQMRRASKSIWQAKTVKCRVQALSADGDWFGRRNAGMAEVLRRFGIH